MKIEITRRVYPKTKKELAENGYTICKGLLLDNGTFKDLKVGSEISVKGYLLPETNLIIDVKDEYAEYKDNALIVNSYEPCDKYLNLYYADSLGAIAGVRQELVDRIYNELQDDFITTIKENPASLMGFKGVTSNIISKIKSALSLKESEIKLASFLRGFNIKEKSKIAKIYKNLGENHIEKITNNPYILVRYSNFKNIDAIAISKYNFKPNSEERINACIEYSIIENERGGNTCIPLKNLEGVVQKQLSFVINIEDYIKEENGFMLFNGFVSRKTMYNIEDYIAKEMKLRLYNYGDSETEYDFSNLPDYLDILQVEAIKSACQNNISIISGGPGTGKSTIINEVVNILEEEGKNVALAAPTGKAAKRLAQTTNRPAYTIHSLFRLRPSEDSIFMENDYQQFFDVLIIDEISMVDVFIMKVILENTEIDTKIVLVGDKDQLPSVNAGNVLSDLMISGEIPKIELKKIFRQKGQLIPLNAKKIKNGTVTLDQGYDFLNIVSENEEATLNILVNSYKEAVRIYGYEEVCCLVPYRKKGAISTNYLNEVLREQLNPRRIGIIEIHIKGTVYREGDRVMETKNKDLVMNGDTGFIKKIHIQDKSIDIVFGKDVVTYDFDDMDTITHAYALTIHKSQGSEYKCVLIGMTNSHYNMLYRNLIYTAVTRGSKKVLIVGNGYKRAISNIGNSYRYTLLGQLLKSK